MTLLLLLTLVYLLTLLITSHALRPIRFAPRHHAAPFNPHLVSSPTIAVYKAPRLPPRYVKSAKQSRGIAFFNNRIKLTMPLKSFKQDMCLQHRLVKSKMQVYATIFNAGQLRTLAFYGPQNCTPFINFATKILSPNSQDQPTIQTLPKL